MKLSTGASRLLSRLQWWFKRFGAIFPSQEKLASGFSVCKRTIQRWLDELRAAGLIRVERRYRRSNFYTLVEIEDRQLDFGFEDPQESPQVVLEQSKLKSQCHHTVVPVVNLSTRILRKIAVPSPLVIVRTVYRRMRAAYKPQADTKRIPTWGEGPPAWEMPKPNAEELAAFLESVA